VNHGTCKICGTEGPIFFYPEFWDTPLCMKCAKSFAEQERIIEKKAEELADQ